MEQVGRVEDSAASGSYFLVAETGDLVAELTVAASCIDNMGVGVAETWHHDSTLCIDILDFIGR